MRPRGIDSEDADSTDVSRDGPQAPPPPPPAPPPSAAALPPLPAVNREPPKLEDLQVNTYFEDGEYVRDIEINHIRNRYLLTKSSTQKEIKDETGADVQVKGKYYPNKAMATEREPPLYLHVTSVSKESLETAIKRIEQLITKDLGSLVDERRFRRPDNYERDEFGRRKWPSEKVPIDIPLSRQFNVRQAIVGQGGANVKHIAGQARARLQIKGVGSGFHEPETGQESDEPIYLHITYVSRPLIAITFFEPSALSSLLCLLLPTI